MVRPNQRRQSRELGVPISAMGVPISLTGVLISVMGEPISVVGVPISMMTVILLSFRDDLISQKVLMKSFYKSRFPHKSVNLFSVLVIVKDDLTNLCGNRL